MSRQIQGVVRRRSKPYIIQRFDREDGYYDDDDGLWVDAEEVEETLSAHLQPITDQLQDGVPAQIQNISWHGWAIDKDGNKVSNKDILTVDEGLFTVANMIYWPGIYREFDLIRSGEAENLAE